METQSGEGRTQLFGQEILLYFPGTAPRDLGKEKDAKELFLRGFILLM